MDKTLKIRAYSDAARKDASKGNHAEEKNKSQELAKKEALLEEERNKSHDLLKTIVQLRESLLQEQTRSAELQAKVNKLDGVEENQLFKKNAQLEEEKKKSLEYVMTIKQLRESIKRDQAISAVMVKKTADLQAKLNKLDGVEENQLFKKNVQLEEEKNKSLEYVKDDRESQGKYQTGSSQKDGDGKKDDHAGSQGKRTVRRTQQDLKYCRRREVG